MELEPSREPPSPARPHLRDRARYCPVVRVVSRDTPIVRGPRRADAGHAQPGSARNALRKWDTRSHADADVDKPDMCASLVNGETNHHHVSLPDLGRSLVK